MNFAINYVLGTQNRVLVVQADDRDDAYEKALSELLARRLFSAALQGSCRNASQADIDAAAVSA